MEFEESKKTTMAQMENNRLHDARQVGCFPYR
jgi:hypothetical protein